MLKTVKDSIEKKQPLRSIGFSGEEMHLLRSFGLLSIKPVLYVCNISEEDLLQGEDNKYVKSVKEYASKEGSEVIVVRQRSKQKYLKLK